MNIKLEKIKAPIEVLKPHDPSDLPLGHNYINHAYPNILLLAKKNSGKTNIIYNILKKCANKNTEVVIFCPTWELDDTYSQILDYLDSRGIPHQQFKNIDNLKDLMDSYDKNFSDPDSDDDLGHPCRGIRDTPATPSVELKEPAIQSYTLITHHNQPSQPPQRGQPAQKVSQPKIRKSKFTVPEHIFIFDDCKKMLRSPVLNSLIATNRHYKSKVIISTQYFTDIMPDTRTCLDIICIFPKIPLDKIKKLHEDIQLSTEYPIFEQLYLKATQKPHNFLYVDIRREQFKFNFDTLCKLE